MEFINHVNDHVNCLINVEINHVYLSIIHHLYGGYSLIYNDTRNDYYSYIMDDNLDYLIKRLSNYARNLQ